MTAQEMRPGLPAVELRRAWRTWKTSHGLLSFTADGMAWAWGTPNEADEYKFALNRYSATLGGRIDSLRFFPSGATWSEVEALAATGAKSAAEVNP